MLGRRLLLSGLAACLAAPPVLAETRDGPVSGGHARGLSTLPARTPQLTPRAISAESDFQQGQRLYFAKRYPEALALFLRSFGAVKSPNSQLYVARCLVELGELPRAHEVYKQLIVLVSEQEQPERYAETQRAATSERAALRQRLSWVRITVPYQPAGLVVRLSGEPLSTEKLRPGGSGDYFYVLPGAIDVQALAPGYPEFVQRLHLRQGQLAEVAIVWAPPPAQAAPSQPVVAQPSAWTNPYYPLAVLSAGVGVIGFGAWAGFSVRAQERYDSLVVRCARGDCPEREINLGKTESRVAQVGLGVGIAGVVTGTTLWILGASGDSPEGPRLALDLGPQIARVRGRF